MDMDGAPPAEALSEELRARLNDVPVRQVIEYVALRLGLVDGHDGHWRMMFSLEGGHLRRAEISHSEIGTTELSKMGRDRGTM